MACSNFDHQKERYTLRVSLIGKKLGMLSQRILPRKNFDFKHDRITSRLVFAMNGRERVAEMDSTRAAEGLYRPEVELIVMGTGTLMRA